MTYKRDKGDIEMNTSEAIKAKRKNLGLTQKDFADALGMGRNGDRTLRRWENGESAPSALEYKTILQFAEKTPFEVKDEMPEFKFIDLFGMIWYTYNIKHNRR